MTRAKREQQPQDPTRCGVCRAPIIHALSHNGVRVRVDAEPSTAGTIALAPRQTTEEPLAYKPTASQRIGKQLHTAHAETCPDEIAGRRHSPHGVRA